MNSPLTTYLADLARYFVDPHSSEMSYRSAFQNYLESIFPQSEKYHIQHDPKAINGNKPDFIVLRNSVPLLYIEVKKLGEDLDKIERSNQATRYFGYTNLIISDYAEFRFFRNGERYDEENVKIATVSAKTGAFTAHPETEERLVRTMRDFVQSQKEPIKSGKHLAKIMGGKAQRIRDNVVALLETESGEKEELHKMVRVIKENLVANLTTHDFADMYAQTLVYGLFAARYNDKSVDDFSRAEARELVPATNPFLRHFFDHISGASFPRRLDIIVSELCEVFSHAAVNELMQEYFKQTNLFGEQYESPDPVIHFYEDFLLEYDPTKKMEMGVFYTPLPVVRFIVRGIDALLKREFGISKGLADTGRTTREVEVVQKNGTMKKVKDDTLHRVQILDVATGTGTFLNETIAHIHETFGNNAGRWGAYVEQDLLARLHGFELMMASYTIAHLKLAMSLQKQGVEHFGKRIGVYLTNTLDAPHDIPLQGTIFGFLDSIAEESKLASRVKNDYPIMVVMGNPPYSGISQNKHYTENEAYKVEPGGKERLKEKKNWLDDDYVKFIRFAESMVEKNGEGIVGMITAHGYIDNPTFRGMRWHLRQTFDALYVLDLHGNSNKKETAPDGGKDENVFDIKTGVAIIFGVKKRAEDTKTNKPLATVYQADLYGKCAEKFKTLSKESIESVWWNTLPADAEVWKVEGKGKDEYVKGFSIAELFPKNTSGIVTMGDGFIVDMDKGVLEKRVTDFVEGNGTESALTAQYGLGKNYAKWVIENRKKIQLEPGKFVPFAYRPFDIRYTYFDKLLVWRTREQVMKHFTDGENTGLIFVQRSPSKTPASYIFVTQYVGVNGTIRSDSVSIDTFAPLYLYADSGDKVPNLDKTIVSTIEETVGTTTPENILDYVYAVLHSPTYRATYGEFLKTDFPRVPYPTDKEVFWKLVALGTRLRGLHLLTDVEVSRSVTSFPIIGSNTVEKVAYEGGKVYINSTQYFEGVPKDVFNFYIGGYQPAQKYLKDRKGRVLTNAEFENYEKMIVSLVRTIEVMGEIDEVS
jgi:predicted helicase